MVRDSVDFSTRRSNQNIRIHSALYNSPLPLLAIHMNRSLAFPRHYFASLIALPMASPKLRGQPLPTMVLAAFSLVAPTVTHSS